MRRRSMDQIELINLPPTADFSLFSLAVYLLLKRRNHSKYFVE